MRKKDIITLAICNLVTLILLVEHCVFHLDMALLMLAFWMTTSLVVHIGILKDYAVKVTFEEV